MEKIEFENQLLQAMKNDDLKSFSFLMPTNADLNLCFGRFPILSILYMYSSFSILSKFEEKLMAIHNYKIVEERMFLYAKFKRLAGKSLRLFQGDEIVYPVHMLAVLNERLILENKYKFLYKNAEIIEKLKIIYNLRHENRLFVNEKKVCVPPSKLKFKQIFISSLLMVVCAVVIALSSIMMEVVSNSIGLGTLNNPIKVSSANEFRMIFDKGSRNYVLTKDLTISCKEYESEMFSGVLDGGGRTLTLEGDVTNSFVKTLSGTIKNLKIKLTNNKIKLTQNASIISQKNNGIIENCEIFGDFTAEYDSIDDVFGGLFVANNLGNISNCVSRVSGTLVNNNESNAYFGSFAGINEKSGQVLNCVSASGVVVADTVDIAGIVAQNYGIIKNVSNKLHLSQTSSKKWHPNVAGVAVSNYGTIEMCFNDSELSAKSSVGEFEDTPYYVFLGGISCENFGTIVSCKNSGKLTGAGEVSNVLIGGITAQNIKNNDYEGTVKTSLNKAYLKGYSEQAQVCAGGVVGMNSSVILNAGSVGTIEVDSKATKNEAVFMNKVDKALGVVAGGVVGVNQNALVQSSYSDTNFVCGTESESLLKVYSGVIGSIGMFKYSYVGFPEFVQLYQDAYRYVRSNYYVAKEEIKQGICGVNGVLEQRGTGLYYNSGVVETIPDAGNEGLVKKCDTFDEIPAEVKINE